MAAVGVTTATLVIWALCLQSVCTQYAAWTPQAYPNPQFQPGMCGMLQPSWVCDPSRTIPPHMVNTMSLIISQTNNDSQGVCRQGNKEGYKMAVGVVGSIQTSNGASPLPPQQAADQFADYLRWNTWSPGSCTNDVVVILVMDTMRIGVAVGSKAAGRLSYKEASSLASEATSRLRADKVGEELSWLLTKYQNLLLDIDSSYNIFIYIVSACGGVVGLALLICLLRCFCKCCESPDTQTLVPKHKEHEEGKYEDYHL